MEDFEHVAANSNERLSENFNQAAAELNELMASIMGKEYPGIAAYARVVESDIHDPSKMAISVTFEGEHGIRIGGEHQIDLPLASNFSAEDWFRQILQLEAAETSKFKKAA